MPATLHTSDVDQTQRVERLATGESGLDALIVEIAGRHYGLPAPLVTGMMRAAAVSPAASEPGIEGLVNLHGAIVPLFDLRAWLHLPPKPIEPSDHFIEIGSDSRCALVRVDRTIDLVRLSPEGLAHSAANLRDAACFLLLAKRPGGLVPILDLESVLRGAWQQAPAGEAGAAEQTECREASA
jgi:purine-binding chemotaxis protein CheW